MSLVTSSREEAYRVTVLPSDILIVLLCMSKCKRLVGGTARIDFIEWVWLRLWSWPWVDYRQQPLEDYRYSERDAWFRGVSMHTWFARVLGWCMQLQRRYMYDQRAMRIVKIWQAKLNYDSICWTSRLIPDHPSIQLTIHQPKKTKTYPITSLEARESFSQDVHFLGLSIWCDLFTRLGVYLTH